MAGRNPWDPPAPRRSPTTPNFARPPSFVKTRPAPAPPRFTKPPSFSRPTIPDRRTPSQKPPTRPAPEPPKFTSRPRSFTTPNFAYTPIGETAQEKAARAVRDINSAQPSVRQSAARWLLSDENRVAGRERSSTNTNVTPPAAEVPKARSYEMEFELPSVNALPTLPTAAPPPPPPFVKSAPIDTVSFDDDAVSEEIIADLLFENIGGQELLTLARYDTVNGQDVVYQPIKNLDIIQQNYNSSNIIRIQDNSENFFANFPIKLNDKIPLEGNGPNGSNIYIDESGSLIIEFINLESDEQIEVQVTSENGIIYESEI